MEADNTSRQGSPLQQRDSFLTFGAPQITEAEIEEVIHSMRSGWLGTGPKVKRFESDFAQYKGLPADHMDAILAIAREHGLIVIEDCAHAVEAEYHGSKTGTLGDFGCFSFYVTKNITTGEGGMILARNPEHIARARVLALHGLSKDAWHRFGDDGYKHYYVTECGYKYNMMDLQAAIGIHQLERVENSWAHRKKIWKRYQEAFAHLPLVRPAEAETGTRHAYHLYTVLLDKKRCGIDRDTFLDEMTRHNIGVGVHYLSIPEHPYYQQRFGWKPEDYHSIPCLWGMMTPVAGWGFGILSGLFNGLPASCMHARHIYLSRMDPDKRHWQCWYAHYLAAWGLPPHIPMEGLKVTISSSGNMAACFSTNYAVIGSSN